MSAPALIPAAFRTRSPRHLAGSRANKHRPVAREMRDSDVLRRRRPLFESDWLMKPNHAMRAVNIELCHGARLPERGNPGAEASLRSWSAQPLTMVQRVSIYDRQRCLRYAGRVTPAQMRRLTKKGRRTGELA